MTGREPYRFAIRAYPAHHRRRHGDELIDTALAMHGGAWSARQSLSFVGNGLRLSLRSPRRWWGLAVLFPVVFGALGAADLVAHLRLDPADPSLPGPSGLPDWHDQVDQVTWPFKWLTIPSLPILIFLLAEKVVERPHRWRVAGVVWTVVGVALVLIVAARMVEVSAALSNVASWRLWPGPLGEGAERSLDELGGFGPRWTPAGIVVRELLAIVALAWGSALALRRCARDDVPVLGAGAVAVMVAGVLFVYKLLTPWSFRADFDFFVGDAVLGATLGELLFFPAPFDPIGSLAIGVAALSMGILIVAWGGVAPPAERITVVVPAARPRSLPAAGRSS